MPGGVPALSPTSRMEVTPMTEKTMKKNLAEYADLARQIAELEARK